MLSFLKQTKLSVILVRFVHTAIVANVAATPFISKSVFTIGIQNGEVSTIIQSAVYILLALVSVCFYYAACFVNPGFVTLPKNYADSVDSDEDDETAEECDMMEKGVKLRHCGFCGVKQPLRAKHCEDCNRCIRRFDHHCPWLGNCVGEGNHRFFLIFLLITLLAIFWSIYILWYSFEIRESFTESIRHNGVWIISGLILSSGGMSVIVLVSIHFYLAVSNLTTWEFLARHRISYLKSMDLDDNPFHLGYVKNCVMFFCSCSFQNWEKVYQKFIAKKKHDEFDC